MCLYASALCSIACPSSVDASRLRFIHAECIRKAHLWDDGEQIIYPRHNTDSGDYLIIGAENISWLKNSGEKLPTLVYSLQHQCHNEPKI